MKREIEGKILSGVSGESEVRAAVAKELNATSTGGEFNQIEGMGQTIISYVGCQTTEPC